MEAVEGCLLTGKHAGEIAFGNQNDAVFSCQPSLNLTEPVIKGRQRKFQHHNGIVGAVDFGMPAKRQAAPLKKAAPLAK